jgi:hypothetical protein
MVESRFSHGIHDCILSVRLGCVGAQQIVVGWAGMVSHRFEAMTGRENENARSIAFSVEGNSGVDGTADLKRSWQAVAPVIEMCSRLCTTSH